MPPIDVIVMQFASVSFGTFHLAGNGTRWLLQPRKMVLRRHERFWQDPPQFIERQAIWTCLLALVALAAWRWAGLRWLWLPVALLSAVLGVAGLVKARRMRHNPSLRPERRADLTDEDVVRLAARGRRVGSIGSGLLLVLWLWSWRIPMRELWEHLTTGPAL